MEQTDYKYFAFISYNSRDIRWGKTLQRKLEHYRMPATLCSEKGWKRTPIRPVFFAPTDIQPGGLTSEIRERLRVSRNLIVICSPNSAQSEWVGKEIAFFHELGRTDNIHFFIVDGEPHSGDTGTECFNPVIYELGLPEILGANIHEQTYRWQWMNKERAYVQLVSKLLGVEFDSIWKRHRRQLVQKIILWMISLMAVVLTIIGAWTYSRPVDVRMQLNEVTYHNAQLPPLTDAVVTLELANEVKTDTIPSLEEPLVFSNIPHHFIDEKVRIRVDAADYHPVDTLIILKNNISVNISRDSTIYGNVSFQLWDEKTGKPVEGKTIEIAGHKACSDTDGMVHIHIPLKEQNVKYGLASDSPMKSNIIYMPCGESTIVPIQL